MMLTAAAVTTVAVQSCSNDKETGHVRVPIVFSRSIVESKGAAPLTTDGMTDFGLYAAYTAQGEFHAADATFNNIVNGKFIESQGKWMGQTDYYWPLNGSLSFVAYAPYSAQGGGIAGLTLPGASAQTGFPVFTYTPPTGGQELSSMPDLCLSTPLIGRSQPLNGDAEVPLEFHHVLTGVSFYGRYAVNYTPGNFSDDYSVKLLSLKLSGVIGTKQVQTTDVSPYFEWQADGTLPKTAEYTLTRQDGQLVSTEFNDADRQIFISQAGMLYLLPQTPANMTVTVAYGVYLKSDDELLATFTSGSIALPANPWEPGAVMEYNLGAVMNLDQDSYLTEQVCATVTPELYNWLQSR